MDHEQPLLTFAVCPRSRRGGECHEAKKRLYADRAACCDRYHHYPRGHPLPCLQPGKGKGASGGLLLESEADRYCDHDVRAGLRRVLPVLLRSLSDGEDPLVRRHQSVCEGAELQVVDLPLPQLAEAERGGWQQLLWIRRELSARHSVPGRVRCPLRQDPEMVETGVPQRPGNDGSLPPNRGDDHARRRRGGLRSVSGRGLGRTLLPAGSRAQLVHGRLRR